VRVLAAKSTLIRRRVAVLTGSVLEETGCDSRMCFGACLEADETTLSGPPGGCDWVVMKGLAWQVREACKGVLAGLICSVVS
jgi:hypothetical protein